MSADDDDEHEYKGSKGRGFYDILKIVNADIPPDALIEVEEGRACNENDDINWKRIQEQFRIKSMPQGKIEPEKKRRQ